MRWCDRTDSWFDCFEVWFEVWTKPVSRAFQHGKQQAWEKHGGASLEQQTRQGRKTNNHRKKKKKKETTRKLRCNNNTYLGGLDGISERLAPHRVDEPGVVPDVLEVDLRSMCNGMEGREGGEGDEWGEERRRANAVVATAWLGGIHNTWQATPLPHTLPATAQRKDAR